MDLSCSYFFLAWICCYKYLSQFSFALWPDDLAEKKYAESSLFRQRLSMKMSKTILYKMNRTHEISLTFYVPRRFLTWGIMDLSCSFLFLGLICCCKYFPSLAFICRNSRKKILWSYTTQTKVFKANLHQYKSDTWDITHILCAVPICDVKNHGSYLFVHFFRFNLLLYLFFAL